jgi:RHS repeat-associated protein
VAEKTSFKEATVKTKVAILLAAIALAYVSIPETFAGARMYDPGTGRFTSVDPMRDDLPFQNIATNAFAESIDKVPRPGGHTSDFNGYVAVRNDPLRYTDPTGEFPVAPILIGIGALIGGSLYSTPVDESVSTWDEFAGPFEGALTGATVAAGVCAVGGAGAEYLATKSAFQSGGYFNTGRYIRTGVGGHNGRWVFRTAIGNNGRGGALLKLDWKDLGPK